MNNNLLKLHEAIAVVLMNKPGRAASEPEIADEINIRKLYTRNDSKPFPTYQIKLRTNSSKKFIVN